MKVVDGFCQSVYAAKSADKSNMKFKPGDTASISKTITDDDIQEFADASGDHNPLSPLRVLTLALSQSEREIRTRTDNAFALCNNLSGRLSLEFIQRSEINSVRLFETKRESTYA